MTRYLTTEDALVIARALFGADPEMRDLGLLEAAVQRPRASAFGVDAYPSFPEKVAALLDSAVNNHALVDGNKRLGLVLAAAFAHLNGFVLRAPHDDLYQFVMDVAAGAIPVGDAARRLSPWLVDGGPAGASPGARRGLRR